jgi:DNA repair exonuclease SbcCD nuclease subunit
MKLLIMGDAHLRGGKPENRLDNYEETQYQKMVWIFEKAKEYDCEYILQPGDLTEHFPYPRMNFECLGRYIELFRKFKTNFNIEIITIRGQHDSSFHKQSENSPISVMEKANVIWVASDYPPCFPIDDNTCIIGCDFVDDIQPYMWVFDFNILLIHKMISNQDYWNGYVQYASPEWMLSKYPDFDLIVSGDNHHSFQCFVNNNRALINCGSLMRSNIDQANHKPCVWVFDTDTFSAEQFFIPIKPFNEVFDLQSKEEGKQTSMENEALIERLEKGFDSSGIDFVKNLRSEMVKEESDVQSIIEECMI